MESDLIFNSHFESGNLLNAQRILFPNTHQTQSSSIGGSMELSHHQVMTDPTSITTTEGGTTTTTKTCNSSGRIINHHHHHHGLMNTGISGASAAERFMKDGIRSLLSLKSLSPKHTKKKTPVISNNTDHISNNDALSPTYQEYELELHHDLHSPRHTQWFYFGVKNMKSNLKVKFSIKNFYKKSSMFNYGMKPLMFSELCGGWRRVGENISYYCNDDEEDDLEGVSPFKAGRRRRRRRKSRRNSSKIQKNKKKPFYTLTFTYTFEAADDCCYFAYCYPYTYTDLQRKLSSIMISFDNNNNINNNNGKNKDNKNIRAGKEENKDYSKDNSSANVGDNSIINNTIRNNNNIYVKREILCKTLAGNNCEMITIMESDPDSNSTHQSNNKPTIIITARVHPGESCSSFVCEGILDFLLSGEAKQLLYLFNFQVVPMLNPDGVINGNSRTSMAGCDLNRRWDRPNEKYHPTIYYTKQMIRELLLLKKKNDFGKEEDGNNNENDGFSFVYDTDMKNPVQKDGKGRRSQTNLTFQHLNPKIQKTNNNNIFMVCDLHGHSRQEGVFLYGCRQQHQELIFTNNNKRASSSGQSQQQKLSEQFPKILDQNCEFFKLRHCNFTSMNKNAPTMRYVMFKEFGIPCSYSMETSLCGADGMHFSMNDLKSIGKQFCLSLSALASSTGVSSSSAPTSPTQHELRGDGINRKSTSVILNSRKMYSNKTFTTTNASTGESSDFYPSCLLSFSSLSLKNSSFSLASTQASLLPRIHSSSSRGDKDTTITKRNSRINNTENIKSKHSTIVDNSLSYHNLLFNHTNHQGDEGNKEKVVQQALDSHYENRNKSLINSEGLWNLLSIHHKSRVSNNTKATNEHYSHNNTKEESECAETPNKKSKKSKKNNKKLHQKTSKKIKSKSKSKQKSNKATNSPKKKTKSSQKKKNKKEKERQSLIHKSMPTDNGSSSSAAVVFVTNGYNDMRGGGEVLSLSSSSSKSNSVSTSSSWSSYSSPYSSSSSNENTDKSKSNNTQDNINSYSYSLPSVTPSSYLISPPPTTNTTTNTSSTLLLSHELNPRLKQKTQQQKLSSGKAMMCSSSSLSSISNIIPTKKKELFHHVE